ncbi:cation transporter [Microcoleus sp. FACHB-SPT15]|uniref:cation diffusion facilitator family transporter n=1 Tax=Microcoleus sp. FACHB-SPT15 TaxID=2692830 RepID=UPI00177E8F59|nr:cation diffusion facilitator family transporter [Microcoleus sp. FACHB-SPT15]MBD1805080.1 cation transporter [Microcoleus sp. FACHB-SPT15]
MHQHSASCTHHTTSISQPSQTTNKVRLLVTVLVLICSFALAELAVGLFSHSLALLADSGHMASDCFALILALLATWLSQRRRSSNLESGNHWFEVLAALVNGVGLVVIAVWVGWEAVERLQSPPVEILSLPMLATASVGFGVNSINIFLLHKDSHNDLNLRGAFLHVLADAASSVGVIIAAIAVWALNWIWADGVISLLVSGLIIISATPLIIQSLNTLLAKSSEC